MTLSRKQISLIHVAKARLGLSDAEYRDILWYVGRVRSSTALDALGFELVMAAFARLGFRSQHARRNFGHRPGMASPKQVAYIRHLWEEYTDGRTSDAGLGKWLDRTFKVSSLRFVTAATAPKAITALLAMKQKKAAKAPQKATA